MAQDTSGTVANFVPAETILPGVLLPEGLAEQVSMVSTLSRRVQYLLSTMPESEIDPPDEVPSLGELQTLSEWIKSEEEIQDFFIGAMICSVTGDPHVECLMAHVLKAALNEMKAIANQEKGRSEHVPRNACRLVRQVHIGKKSALRPLRNRLPKIRSSKTSRVKHWIKALRKRLKDEGDSTLYKLLTPLESLLSRNDNERVIQRTRIADPARHTHPVAPHAETEIGAVKIISCYNQVVEDDIDPAPQYLDMAPSGPSTLRGSLAAQKLLARAANLHITRNNMMSPCRWGTLFSETLKQLVTDLRAGVEARNPVDALLTISLFTGRSVAALNRMRVAQYRQRRDDSEQTNATGGQLPDCLVHRQGRLGLRTGLLLPPPDGSPEIRSHYLPSKVGVYLSLPTEILPCLLESGEYSDKKWMSYANPKKIDERLKELKQKSEQVTETRIRSAGHLWLYKYGLERTVLSRLFGTSLSHAAPLFYECMKESRILEAYEAWYQYLNGLLPSDRFTMRTVETEARVGSRRTPKQDELGELLASYRRFVKTLLTRSAGTSEAHNHFVAYTYLLLSAGTGLRPVRQPFETFDDFCSETNTYYVRDKDAGGLISPRYVPVAPFAVQQLNHYRNYLSRLAMHLRSHRSRQYVLAALKSRVPFLFTLEDGPRAPVPLRPAEISKLLKDFFPLVPNWARHLQRTALAGREVDDDVIQAFMGHGESGQEPFSRYSALTWAAVRDVSEHIEAIGDELNIQPLSHGPSSVYPTLLDQAVDDTFEYEAQRKKNARSRRKASLKETKIGLNWAKQQILEATKRVDELKDTDVSEAWSKDVMRRLDEALRKKGAWMAARAYLASGLDAMNGRFKLAIPIPAPPQRLHRTPPMHNGPAFRSRKAVHGAARSFLDAIQEGDSLVHMSKEELLPLVLFSSACFGALADPEALLAFGQALHKGKTHLKYANGEKGEDLCWLDFRYETKRANNTFVDGEPNRLHRFFTDGTTLMLLIRYFNQKAALPTDSYRDAKALMKDMALALSRLCEKQVLDASITLGKFCRGAVGVAESQPGVELPHYLAEYACGLIESVSLPEPFFSAYLGKERSPKETSDPLPSVTGARVKSATVSAAPEIDKSIRRIQGLFVELHKLRKDDARARLLERLQHLLSDPPSLGAQLLAEWFQHLLTRPKRKLQVSTVSRYSNWITTGLMLMLDEADFKHLTGDDWMEKYEGLLDQLPEEQRDKDKVAGRICDFHNFLRQGHEFPPIPNDFSAFYRGKRHVRARIIPERIFSEFIRRLLDMPEDESFDAYAKESIRWLFTLCYRLGTRIGETTRIRLADIEDTKYPIVKLRATPFGNTKTKTPHQLPLNPFLPAKELEGFRAMLAERRQIARRRGTEGRRRIEPDKNAFVFETPSGTNEPWDTRALARLFSQLMYDITGLHLSPHSCRHSAASRLILLAEDEFPPEGSAYTEEERRELKKAIFTSAPNCRDRMWHLAAVFNHVAPSTTFKRYVHFADLLLRRKLARNQRRFMPKVLRDILGVSKKRFAESQYCNQDGFLVEKIIPIVFASKRKYFEVVERAVAPEVVPQVGTMEHERLHGPPLFTLAQPILEDFEDGVTGEVVAERYGIDFRVVEALHESATKLANLRTRVGKRRLFSPERLKTDPFPLSPTRAVEAEDRELLNILVRRFRGEYAQKRHLLRSACIYWLTRSRSSGSEVAFHSTENLRDFLAAFVESDQHAISRNRWLILVSRVETKSHQELMATWSVFNGIRVGIAEDKKASPKKNPDGIAYLHLQKQGPIKRKGATKDTSKSLRYLMHMLSILFLADDIVKNRKEAIRDWPIEPDAS